MDIAKFRFSNSRIFFNILKAIMEQLYACVILQFSDGMQKRQYFICKSFLLHTTSAELV